MPRKKTTPTIIDPVTTYDITPAALPEFAHPLPPPHMADDYLKAVLGVATTEPDTTLNPDRAQVAAVADLPHAPEPFAPDEDGEPLDAYAARLQAERNALVDGLRATIAEQSARIAELTAERDTIQHHHDEWMKFRGDADWELANLRRDGREEDRKRIAELEAEATRVRDEVIAQYTATVKVRDEQIEYLERSLRGNQEMERRRDRALADIIALTLTVGCPADGVVNDADPMRATVRGVKEVMEKLANLEAKVAEPARPLTPHEIVHGYRAVASGQVKAAEWKGRRLVRLHGNPEPIAMYDHPEPPPGCMPSGFVAEVASGTTRIMSPPLKDEAEARAWCEARCGWTVVA